MILSMRKLDIKERLREIIGRDDLDSEGLINRKESSEHDDGVGVLLDHLSILISYLRFDAEASRRELFALKNTVK